MKFINNIIGKYQNLSRHVKAAAWFLICSFLQKGISVITTPIFTRILTTSEYGQYSVFDSWLKIITVVVSMNMYYGVYTQGLIKFDEEREIFSSSLQGLSLTLVAIWTAVYFFFRDFWNGILHLTTAQVLAMMIIIWATGVFNYWASEQRVNLTYRKLVIVTLLISFAKPVVGIVFVIYAYDKVMARILGLALVELIGYTGLFFAQMRKGKVFYSKNNWKYAIGLCVPLIPHYLSQSILNGADKIMIERMIGNAEAGIYGLAYSLSMLMTMVNTALHQTINPWLYQKIKEKKEKDIARVAYPTLVIVAIANIFLIALAPEVVDIFAPQSYHDAIWIVPPVAMSTFFMFAYCLFADFEFYYEKTKFIATATVLSAVLNIVLNQIFIKIFDYYAAGYTTLFCYIAYTLGHYFFMKRICRDNGIEDVYNPKILIGIAVVFFIIGFFLLFTYKHPIVRYSFIGLAILFTIVFRKNIIEVVRGIMSMKKIGK